MAETATPVIDIDSCLLGELVVGSDIWHAYHLTLVIASISRVSPAFTVVAYQL